MRSLAILSSLLVVGCASLPDIPEGKLCTLKVDSHTARCVDIHSGEKSYISFEEMNDYVSVSPATWQEIQVYILKLKSIAEQRCQ